jgi:hypothetical protein
MKASKNGDSAASCHLLVLQDLWWHLLGSSSDTKCATQVRGADWLPAPKHSCARSAATVISSKYPQQLLASYDTRTVTACTNETVHLLLLSELWGLWPWQLQQLQRAANSSQGSSHCSPVSSSISHSTTAASLSSTAVTLAFPLLPVGAGGGGSALGGSSTPSPVTLEQLWLVTHIMCQGPCLHYYSAGLLISLLLQRADPGLRAEFLGSPWGSYFLDVLVTVPTHEAMGGKVVGWRGPGPSMGAGAAQPQLEAALQGRMPLCGWNPLPAATSCLLALAWAHLVVKSGCDMAAAAEGWALLGTCRNLIKALTESVDLPGKRTTLHRHQPQAYSQLSDYEQCSHQIKLFPALLFDMCFKRSTGCCQAQPAHQHMGLFVFACLLASRGLSVAYFLPTCSFCFLLLQSA